MNDFGIYGNIGLAVEGIEIYFPLTKELSLGLWCSSHKEKFIELYEKCKYLSSVAPDKVAQVLRDPLYLEKMKAGIERGQPIRSEYGNTVNHNALQVEHATRFVYSSNEDFSLAEEMIEANPGFREGPKIEMG